MSNTTPRTDARVATVKIESEDPYCGLYVKIDGQAVEVPELVDADFARQLETELAAANASKDAISKRAEAIRCELVESTKREAQLREALEHISEYWNHAPESAVDAIETAEGLAADALNLPAPPVVPLADVKPILDAVNRLPKCDNRSTTEHKAACARCLLHKSLAAFTAKHPQP